MVKPKEPPIVEKPHISDIGQLPQVFTPISLLVVIIAMMIIGLSIKFDRHTHYRRIIDISS